MILRVKRPYIHLVQKPALCGATCIQMILLRRGKFVGQEKLAFELGTKIYKNQKQLYGYPFGIVSEGSPKYGLEFSKFGNNVRVKRVLHRHGLRSKVYELSKIKDVESFIKQTLEKGQDLIVGFRFDPIDKRTFGHYALVTAFDTKKKQVELCDPYHQNKAQWSVSLKKLIVGMSAKWTGKERGFVVIS